MLEKLFLAAILTLTFCLFTQVYGWPAIEMTEQINIYYNQVMTLNEIDQ